MSDVTQTSIVQSLAARELPLAVEGYMVYCKYSPVLLTAWYAVWTICSGVNSVLPSCENWIASSNRCKYRSIGRSTSMGSARACLHASRFNAWIFPYLSMSQSTRLLADTRETPCTSDYLRRGMSLQLPQCFTVSGRRPRSCQGCTPSSLPYGWHYYWLVPLMCTRAYVLRMGPDTSALYTWCWQRFS